MPINFNLTCGEISEIVGGKLTGDSSLIITGLNNIEFAQNGEITFYSDKKFEKFLVSTKASCVIVSDTFKLPEGAIFSYIRTQRPYDSFAAILMHLNKNYGYLPKGVDKSAVIEDTAVLGTNVFIGANCYIGDRAKIGNNVSIYPNVSIYNNVEIDEGTTIHSNVVICEDTCIGKNCLILPGAVIGSDGFGFLESKDSTYTRIPQFGNVIIEDDVEIGANTTIDRALVGSTIIHKGVKLDNLIQIAHNVRVGENSAMASQVGISGSTHIGKRNRIGGQVGLSGHISTADDVVLYAQSGVAASIDNNGIYFGSPAYDRLTAFRITAAIHDLPQMVRELRELKEEVKKLKESK